MLKKETMIRQMATAGVIAAAVGGPYVATETEIGKTLSNSLQNVVATSSSTGEQSSSGGKNSHHLTETLWDRKLGERDIRQFGTTEMQTIAGGPVADFRDVLRFDITPNWVTAHFSRVTTVLSELNLEGMRVPIVTGTRNDDVAGSLTYYFRHDGKLQRVAMHGFTGDPTRLVEIMTKFYKMQPRSSLDSGVYTTEWNGRPSSILKITRAPIMYADATRSQHTVFLELNQPNYEYGLSLEAQRIVGSDWSTGRW